MTALPALEAAIKDPTRDAMFRSAAEEAVRHIKRSR